MTIRSPRRGAATALTANNPYPDKETLTMTWTDYQLSRTTDDVMQAAIREVAQMLEAGEITEARATELIDFIR